MKYDWFKNWKITYFVLLSLIEKKTVWEVYFKYTLSMLNLYFDPWSKKKYALTEISKQKYKWSMKTEKTQKVLCLYFNDISLILLDSGWNKGYFKYTSDFKTKCFNLGNLTQIYFWVRT